MRLTARLVCVGLLVALASPGRGQESPFYELGELSQRGQRSVLTTPTVAALDTTPEADTQVVMYRVVWRPVIDVGGRWQPAPAPPVEGPWLFTQVGEDDSGFPGRSAEFADAETLEPISSHHADLPPGTAHLVQVELRWFPAGSAQFVHQEVRALQVTQGPGVQPHPGPAPPQEQPASRAPLTPRALQQLAAIGTGFHVAPGFVLTNAHVVEGHATVLVERGGEVQEARVHAIDAALDLALLEHSLDAPPLPFRLAPLRPHEEVRACGALSLRRGAAAPPHFEGVVWQAGDRLVVRARENLESAGGALVDPSGRVVGVVLTSTTAGGRGTLEALSGPAALRWLRSRNVTPTVTNGVGPGLARVAAASVRVYAPAD